MSPPTEAAIDANAPHNLSDNEMLDPAFGGAVDSDEERDNVMTALRRSLANPQPLAHQVIFPQRKKYQMVRMKEILGNAMVGNRGGVGLFSVVVDTGNRDSSYGSANYNNVPGSDTTTAEEGAAAGGGSSTTTATANTPIISSPQLPRKASTAAGQSKMRKPSAANSAAGD